MIASTSQGNAAFSSDVRLSVESGDFDHSLSTVEPDRFVLTEPQQLDACDAVLVVSVNGEPRRTPIRVTGSAEPVREYAYTVR